MLGASLVLALALGPEPATAPQSDELPHWNSAPAPAPEHPAEPKPPKVPSDGVGMITLGSVLFGTSAALGLTSVGLKLANDPATRTGREATAVASGGVFGVGVVMLTLGLVVRRQFQRSPVGKIPDAPRTGNGMLFGGFTLLAAGTVFAIQAGVDMSIVECTAMGCHQTRPIGAPVQLGVSLAGMAVGTGLVFGGVKRRLGYQKWAQLQPSIDVGPTSFMIGVAGRF